MHTQPSIVLFYQACILQYISFDCKLTSKICIIYGQYNLLYKQVQSATAIIMDTPLTRTQQKGGPRVKSAEKHSSWLL